MGEQGTLTKRAQDREMASRDRGETDSKDAIQARVRDALDDIRKIQEICHVPSISFGILHKGEVIFRESLGVADTKTKDPATADTLYCLASVSKNFVSALAGIAVSEGKLDCEFRKTLFHWSKSLGKTFLEMYLVRLQIQDRSQ